MSRPGASAAVLSEAEFEELRTVLAATDVSVARVSDELRRRGRPVGPEVVGEVRARVLRETVGLGPLQALVEDAAVTDVLVNGPGPVWVDRGRGPEVTGVRFDDEQEVRRLAQRLAALGAAVSTTPPGGATCGSLTGSAATPCSGRWLAPGR